MLNNRGRWREMGDEEGNHSNRMLIEEEGIESK